MGLSHVPFKVGMLRRYSALLFCMNGAKEVMERRCCSGSKSAVEAVKELDCRPLRYVMASLSPHLTRGGKKTSLRTDKTLDGSL